MRKLFRALLILMLMVTISSIFVFPVLAQDYDFTCVPSNIEAVDTYGGVALLGNGVLAVANRGVIEIWHVEEAQFSVADQQGMQPGRYYVPEIDQYIYDGSYEGADLENVDALIMYTDSSAGQIVIAYPDRAEIVPFSIEEGFVFQEVQFIPWHEGSLYQQDSDNVYVRWYGSLTNTVPSNKESFAVIAYNGVTEISEENLPMGAFEYQPPEILQNAGMMFQWFNDVNTLPMPPVTIIGQSNGMTLVQTADGVAFCTAVEHEEEETEEESSN